MLLRRCLVAAASAALAAFAMTLVPDRDWCTGTSCILLGIVVGPLMLMAAALLAWLIMGLARVRDAWQVALGGPLVMLALGTTVLDMSTWPVAGALVVVAACYALAAFVTADTPPRAWRVALVSPVVALFGWGVVVPIVLAML
jgi:hypothetical protein